MSGGKKPENRDQNACRLPGTSHGLLVKLIALMQYIHPRQSVTFVTLHVIPLSVREQRRINISRRARVPPAINAQSRQEFLSLYYKAGRYASQVEYVQIYLQR